MALTDYTKGHAIASTYDADERNVNEPTDTVQGRLTGLLDSNSNYIQRAEAKGRQYANSRGLLNSSIGAGAARASAIDAAMPIAQQDASTYANTRLHNQDAVNRARAQNATFNTDISKLNAGLNNSLYANEQNYLNQRGLNQQNYGFTTNLKNLDFTHQGLLNEQNFGFDTQARTQAGDILSRQNLEKFGYDTQGRQQAGDIQAQRDAQLFGYDTSARTQAGDIQAQRDAELFGYDTSARTQAGEIAAQQAAQNFGYDTQARTQAGDIASQQAIQNFGFDTQGRQQASELQALRDAQLFGYDTSARTQAGDIAAQQAAQNFNYDTQGRRQVADITSAQDAARFGYDTQARQQAGDIAANQVAQNFGYNTQLNEQQNEAKMQLQTMQEEGANYRAELSNKYNLDGLDSKDNAMFMDVFDNATRTYQANKLSIMTDPDLSPESKAAAESFLTNSYETSMEANAALMGIGLDFSDVLGNTSGATNNAGGI